MEKNCLMWGTVIAVILVLLLLLEEYDCANLEDLYWPKWAAAALLVGWFGKVWWKYEY